MIISAIDVVQVRNMPVPRAGKKKLPMPDHGLSTLIQIHAVLDDDRRLTGIGEIRAMPFLTGEAPLRAYNFASRLGAKLIGAELGDKVDGWDAARATHDLVTQAIRTCVGIADDSPLPDTLFPAVRFAYDCALLDLCARARDQSVVELLAGEIRPVRRNVYSRNFDNPGLLVNSLLKGNRPVGWLRGGYSKGGTSLATIVRAVAAAAAGGRLVEGIWLDINGRWAIDDLRALLDELSMFPMAGGKSIGIILEQPFMSYATGYYRQAIALLKNTTRRNLPSVRLMLDDGLVSAASLAAVAEFMPYVDLKITPQKCGSFHAIREMLEAARGHGFVGKVYLGNAGTTTEMNTLVLTALAQLLPEVGYFSAGLKTDGDIRQIHPQVHAQDPLEQELISPDGPGWATRLCQSTLKKRLVRFEPLRGKAISPDTHSARILLIMNAFDDSQLHAPAAVAADEEFQETGAEGHEGAEGDETAEGVDGEDAVLLPAESQA